MSKQSTSYCCDICGETESHDFYTWKQPGEYFGKVLCDRHYLQMRRHGKILSVERIRNKIEHKCYACGTTEANQYHLWLKNDEYNGKSFCNHHYNQLIKFNKLLDTNYYVPHDTRKYWTEEEINILKECYLKNYKMQAIADLLKRTTQECSSKAVQLGITKLITKKNNINYKAPYQEYEWCYERYINQGLSMDEMAEEAGCKKRTIQKWCGEIHKLNGDTFKYKKQLNQMQYDIILVGTLGDGHIDKREDQPMYIETHAQDEKEYLKWKHSYLKDLCIGELKYYKESYHGFGAEKEYLCQPHYRLNTRIIFALKEIRNMKPLDKINSLNEFQLCLLLLDDGSRNEFWQLCVAEWTQEEINAIINKFLVYGLRCKQIKDKRYLMFDSISSNKLDNIILQNIPNKLDIIKKKITENPNRRIGKNNYYYILTDTGKISFSKYCKENHLEHNLLRPIIINHSSDFNEIEEKNFLELIKEVN